jgi:hypothetical protein
VAAACAFAETARATLSSFCLPSVLLPQSTSSMKWRQDSTLSLSSPIFVTREFLLRNYSLEKHQSDVFDQFQLQYLAMDRFAWGQP